MFSFTVEYEGGETVDCEPGQREIAAWEMEPFGCGLDAALRDKTTTFFRYLCWSWLKRTKGDQRTFKQWSAFVVEVRDQEAPPPPDPTVPGPSQAD